MVPQCDNGSHLVAGITSSGTNYYHSDLQSTRVVTNSSGTVQTQQQTAPFGETVIDTGGTTAFKFSSYKRDVPGIGTDYAHALRVAICYGDLASAVTSLGPYILSM